MDRYYTRTSGAVVTFALYSEGCWVYLQKYFKMSTLYNMKSSSSQRLNAKTSEETGRNLFQVTIPAFVLMYICS